jgi:hypothetical protein
VRYALRWHLDRVGILYIRRSMQQFLLGSIAGLDFSIESVAYKIGFGFFPERRF